MSYNTAQIKDRAREMGRNISDEEAATIMNVTGGGDEGAVMNYLQNGTTSSGSPMDLLKNMVQTSINKYQQQLDDYNRKYREFDEKNPFVFDKVLEEEKTKVSQRLDPYYNQTLNDFLTGINTKRQRSLEDERTLLTELNRDVDQFTGRQRENLEYTLDRTGQGYADAGLYTSGQELRAEGRQVADAQDTLGDYMQKADTQRNRIATTGIRQEEDLSLSEKLQRRDLEREKQYQVSSQALGETEMRQRQREFERGQYTGAAPGVDPMSYQNNLYGLLG